ncbi:MAG: glycosyltransferase [Rhodopirellula sp.]|nr:glycosyltransferase [Rhodopirellula sp.]
MSDLTGGGAAIACRRLFRAIRSVSDCECKWFAARGTGSTDVTTASMWPDWRAFTITRLLTHIPKTNATQDRVRAQGFERTILKMLTAFSPDAISLHNIHEALPFGFAEKLARRWPIVWTMHDMWPFTGGCTYSLDCTNYLEGCCGCPLGGGLRSAPDSHVAWERRKHLIESHRSRIVLVSPSHWLATCASNSLGKNTDVRVIPHGVDRDVFRPLPVRRHLRRILGVDESEKVVVCGADLMMSPRKGMVLFLEAIDILHERWGKRPRVVLFGDAEKMFHKGLPANAVFAGRVRDEAWLNVIYNMADLFVMPSIAEAFGLVLLEAMCAGTPSVAFNSTASHELVADGGNGFLASPEDAVSLADCMHRGLTLPEADWAAMSRRCREMAESEYQPETQAGRYLSVIDDVLG